MKIAIVNKSDSTGGAAVVSLRLCKALRNQGHDARMIVVEKLTNYDWVIPASSGKSSLFPFLAERLEVFLLNGLNRKTLFQLDTASFGLPVYNIPFLREADVICLNWINQGMVSIKGIRKILKLGKPVVWTMHDMWDMTGICHHAGECSHYKSPNGECGKCPLLGAMASTHDLSNRVFKNKVKTWNGVKGNKIHFVAVSNWLADLARSSSLLRDMPIHVIPNAFPLENIDTKYHTFPELKSEDNNINSRKKIIFGAARIDDPVKGHDTLVRSTQILAEQYPVIANSLELITFGGLKNPDALNDVGISHTHLGKVAPNDIHGIYESGDIVVSTSEWETLPGTLIEGQAWGCIPVCLGHGGQPDIVEHLKTGWMAPYSDNPEQNALSIAEGIVWAAAQDSSIKIRMNKSVCDRFSEEAVANQYIDLFNSLLY